MSKKPTTNESLSTNPGPAMPEIAPRPTVNAAAALGLPESPHDTLTNAVNKMRKDNKHNPFSPFSNEPTTDSDNDDVEEPEAKPAKVPKAKEDKKPASGKPKHISDKPVGAIEDKKDDEEVEDQEPVNSDESEDKSKKDTEPAPAKVEPSKPEESEAFKKLAQENAELKKKVEEVLLKMSGANPAPTAPAAAAKKDEPKVLTPEEIKKQESEWIQDVANNHLDAALSVEDHEAILDGGPKAVEKVIEMRKRDMAQSILRARQIAASDFNPKIEQLMSHIARLAPVYDDYLKTQAYRVEQAFTNAHPELKPHIKTARAVAKALFEKHPDIMNAMSEEETFAEVRKQTVDLLKSFGIDIQAATLAAPAVNVTQPVTTPAAPVAPVTTPAATVTPPVAPVQNPAPAVTPMPKPPGSTAPGAMPQGGTTSRDKHKAIAESLTY